MTFQSTLFSSSHPLLFLQNTLYCKESSSQLSYFGPSSNNVASEGYVVSFLDLWEKREEKKIEHVFRSWDILLDCFR